MDLPEHKNYSHTLHQQILLAIRALTEQTLRNPSQQILLELVTLQLCELTAATSSFVHLVNDTEKYLELVANGGVKVAPLGQKLSPGQGMAGTAWETGEICFVDDYANYPNRLRHLSGIQQTCAMPMTHNGSVVGVLGVMFSSHEESLQNELELLQQYANLVCLALQNANLILQKESELKLTRSLSRLTEDIAGCQSMQDLFSVATRGIVDYFGSQKAQGWLINDGDQNQFLAGHMADGIRMIAITPDITASKTDVPLELQRLTSSPLSAKSPFIECEFANSSDIGFVLLDGNTAWGLVRVAVTNELSEYQTNLLRSTISHISLAGRINRMLEKATYRANHDQLTGLANRANFFHVLTQTYRITKQDPEKLTVFYLDLDGFKRVNDTSGHAEGDALIISVAQRLQKVMRDAAVISRFGGDEFVAGFWNIEKEDIVLVAKQLLKVLQQPFNLNSSTRISASIGIATASHDATRIDELVKQADQAMYYAKRAGKNRFAFHSDIEASKPPASSPTSNINFLRKLG